MASTKTPARLVRWTIAAVYTLAIFFVAQFVPAAWLWLAGLLGTERAGFTVDRAVPAVGVLAVAAALVYLRERRVRSYLWLAAVFAGFGYVLTLQCEYPIERVHLLQYSLLAWLYFRALRLDCADRAAYIGAGIAVLLVGLTDELMQGLLAKRACTLSDMVTNWLAGGLGLVGLLALQRDGLWTWYARRRLPVRWALGYAIPVLCVAGLGHQMWTRYFHPPLNLVLVTVDCWRPDRLSCYGYDRQTTRFVDKVAARGVRFTRAYSQAAWTGPGVLSTLTGLYPQTHGVTEAGKSVPVAATTLLDAFRERGYKAPNLSFLTVAPNYHNLGAVDAPGIDVTKTDEIAALFKWIDQNHRDPFAIWYHYRFIHLPFDPPPHHRVFPPADDPDAVPPPEIANVVQKEVIIPWGTVTFSEDAEAWLDALYDGHVRQFDHAFEGLRYRLALHHLLDHTLIVLIADHGEELLEHGYIGHASTAVHSRHFEEHLRIPLILHCPRVLPKGRVLDTMVQQVDVLPTVFDIMGWAVPPEVQGRSLLPAMRGETMPDVPVFAESIQGGYQAKDDMKQSYVRSITTREWKLIVRSSPDREGFKLYNLTDDPEERNNVYRDQPGVTASLFGQLTKWRGQTETARLALMEREAARAPTTQPAKIDPTTLEAPRFLAPRDGAMIDYDSANGAVALRWTGQPDVPYVIEYHIGTDWHTLKDELPVVGAEKVFGPLPRDAWKPLYQWNPYRVRVRPRDLPDGWSDWVTIHIAPLE